MAKQPAVTWAQRESFVFVTIEIDEAKIDDLSITDGNKFHFQGTSHSEKFETTFTFFDEVKGDEIKRAESNSRVVELSIPKKENKWWPRLLKDKGKVHWLRVDFDKWKDEDDSGAEEGIPGGMNGFDFNQYMSSLGGGAGAGGQFNGDLDGFDGDSDDDEMPELEDAKEDEAEGAKEDEAQEKAASTTSTA